jgi:two-component system response regulator AtoC
VDAEVADGRLTPEVLFGSTEEMQRIRKLVERIAPVRVPVLFEGESGAGKEVIAVYLHQISPWGHRPFLKVNCAAIPGALLESELFGYEKGSFTGAYSSRPGKFELASDGTILLDEIADMDSSMQAKLLQVLQDGRFFRIGDMEERCAEARIVCITSRKVEAEIERGGFREDLYYRINVVNVRVPPLRERLQDLPALVDYFIAHYGKLYDREVAPLPGEILDRFRKHAWPGNIRELENYLRRYVILGSTDGILSDLEQRGRDIVVGGFKLESPEDFSLKKFSKQAAQRAEKFLILEALKHTRWNRKRAAELLQISYRALLYKLSEAGLPRKKRPPESV